MKYFNICLILNLVVYILTKQESWDLKKKKNKTKKHHWTTENSYLMLINPYYKISGGKICIFHECSIFSGLHAQGLFQVCSWKLIIINIFQFLLFDFHNCNQVTALNIALFYLGGRILNHFLQEPQLQTHSLEPENSN